MQARLAFRNERTLYQRVCDATGKKLISVYPPGTSFPVYEQASWWSDAWDASSSGRSYDPRRSFFEQFGELLSTVPRRNLISVGNANSDFTNVCSYNKNCYLLFSSDECEDCCYVSSLQKCRNCFDSTLGSDSELCFDCFDFHRCYGCVGGEHLRGCESCVLCSDCVGCHNCALSSGLRNARYVFGNEQLSKEEYSAALQQLELGSFSRLSGARERFSKLVAEAPQSPLGQLAAEESSGYYLRNVSRCESCSMLGDSQDCAYVSDGVNCTDCVDCNEIGEAELCYQSVEIVPKVYGLRFCSLSANSSDMEYSDHCYDSRHLFGCVGLRKKEYCILNKQLSKDTFETLRAEIIVRMKADGEWGRFLPGSLSPFAYNETSAQEIFPLTEAEARRLGYRWRQAEERTWPQDVGRLPDDVRETSSEVLGKIFRCAQCLGPYQIIKQELAFLKGAGLALPRDCPNCRHLDRRAKIGRGNLRGGSSTGGGVVRP